MRVFMASLTALAVSVSVLGVFALGWWLDGNEWTRCPDLAVTYVMAMLCVAFAAPVSFFLVFNRQESK